MRILRQSKYVHIGPEPSTPRKFYHEPTVSYAAGSALLDQALSQDIHSETRVASLVEQQIPLLFPLRLFMQCRAGLKIKLLNFRGINQLSFLGAPPKPRSR